MKRFPIRPAWTPLNIVLMVLGFIIFWPLGIAMLVWIIWGDRMVAKVQDAEVHWHTRKTGNEAFDDYRREQLDRLEDERRQLDQEAEDFQEFLHGLRRARDKEEFDSFMSARRQARPARSKSGKAKSGKGKTGESGDTAAQPA